MAAATGHGAAGLYPREAIRPHLPPGQPGTVPRRGRDGVRARLSARAEIPPRLQPLARDRAVPADGRMGGLPLDAAAGLRRGLSIAAGDALLERIGVFTIRAYLSSWRVAILSIFVVAMILTPSGDPYSMCLMAMPLTVLYFGGVLLCHFLPRREEMRD